MTGADPRITAFSFRRQGLDGSGRSALAVIGAVVGVYSAMPSGPLSIRVRAPHITPDDVPRLEAERHAVRMRAMRGSAFLVPRSLAPRLASATAGPPGRYAWLQREAGVRDDELPRVREAVCAAAAQPATLAELRERLHTDPARRDVDASWARGTTLARVLSLLTALGDLVAVGPPSSLSSNTLRYVDRASWFRELGAGSPDAAAADSEPVDEEVSPEAARAWLAGAYLRAFGPARVDDLAWWAGWSRTQAAAAVAAHETVAVGDGLWLLAADKPAFEAVEPLPPVLTLLPKWDAWTMGYPLGGRDRFIDRAVHDRVFDGDGNGLGMVLRGGRAIGAWAHRGERGVLAASVDLFAPIVRAEQLALEAALVSMAGFLGYRGSIVREVATVQPARRRQRRPLGE